MKRFIAPVRLAPASMLVAASIPARIKSPKAPQGGLRRSEAADLTVRIVAVADGDALTLLDSSNTQHKIRIDGIATPEEDQAYSQQSKESKSDAAFGRDARAHCPKVDRYRHEVCKLLVEGADVGLEEISRGMAWVFVRYARELEPDRRDAYIAAEAEAREARRGLWVDARPTPPWEWRT
jgi:endonuclease YncB( thermonuclease family)